MVYYLGALPVARYGKLGSTGSGIRQLAVFVIGDFQLCGRFNGHSRLRQQSEMSHFVHTWHAIGHESVRV